jgi:hypothetical protein
MPIEFPILIMSNSLGESKDFISRNLDFTVFAKNA